MLSSLLIPKDYSSSLGRLMNKKVLSIQAIDNSRNQLRKIYQVLVKNIHNLKEKNKKMEMRVK